MTASSPTRIDDDLFASAKAAGAVLSRSASQQISHWARIGRALEASGTLSQRAIAEVLAGERGYDELSVREQAVVRAEWDERIRARLESPDLARVFTAAAGTPYTELDENGHVVWRQPEPGPQAPHHASRPGA